MNDNSFLIKLIEEKLVNNAIYEHILSKARLDGINDESEIKKIAISFGLYKEWRK